VAAPRQTSLARLAEFGIVPRRSLGQNFLIDDNILGVILERLASDPADVVVEVGAGLGVLTRALAGVSARVHAFEIDERLLPALRATLGPLLETDVAATADVAAMADAAATADVAATADAAAATGDGHVKAGGETAGVAGGPHAAGARVILHLEDVMRSCLETLTPVPTLCASNLPYSVAAPFLAEAMTGLPLVRRYCVMVQREIADRLAAAPSTKAYGGVSAWVQLHMRVVDSRPLSRAIFYPKPRVDSSLLTLERRPEDRPASEGGIPAVVLSHPALVRRVIDAAFGQRRKTAVNALGAASGLPKETLAAALTDVGASAGARAEQLTPEQFAALAARLAEDWPR
jgi:16S rRNA (adenine1518-N6/adenine1519-N6)-dimethyltransferase